MTEASERRFNAMDIQKAVDDLEECHQRIAAIMKSFPRNREEGAFAAEIQNDLDRAIAKLRFYFTTLESASKAVRYALECEWGECPNPD